MIGDHPVSTIETTHVLKVLEPIWTFKTETAKRLRGRIENVLDWATARRFRTGENSARWRGHLDKLLARPSKVAKGPAPPGTAVCGCPRILCSAAAAGRCRRIGICSFAS